MSDHNWPIYRAFLLRCWSEKTAALDQQPAWRFSVTVAAEQQTQHDFGSMAALVDFLRTELDQAARSPPGSGE